MKKKLKKAVAVLLFFALMAECIPYAQGEAKTVIRLNKKKLTVGVGKKKSLKVIGTKKKVIWSVKNKKIVMVSKKGIVKGRVK